MRPPKGFRRIEVRDSNGDPAVLEVRYRKILLPTIGKQTRYSPPTLPVIHAEERGTPNNKKKIDWKSTTDRLVGFRADAIGKLEWYAFEMED